MARKYYRKFKRLQKEGQNSQIVLKLRAAWKRKSTRGIAGVLIVVAVILGVYLFNTYHRYDDYKVLKSIRIEGGANSRYIPFEKFIVKYNSDGVSYIDGKETVWTDAYEMKAPMADVCGSYLAIADKNTNDILIYNKKGRTGTVSTSYPITKIEIAKQGVVAALLEDKKANYIEVYDKEGKRLVSHKTLIAENGYPVNFSLSDDGTKMIVSYVSVNKGMLSSKIRFYNFSDAGKNSENRMVGEFDQYGETIVPTVCFVSNNDAIAVGEDVFSIYKMKDKPDLKKEIKLKDEIQKVFYSEEYTGFVFKNTNSSNPYRVEVYNSNGNRVMKTEIGMNFDTVKFAEKNVLMYNDMNCMLLSLKGVKKFEHTFKGELSDIIPAGGTRSYLFMTNSAIEKVKLK